MPKRNPDKFWWNGPEVAKVMRRKRIADRQALAQVIEISPTTVRRSFDEQWEGEATGPIATAICRKLKVAPQKILRDPRYY